MIYEYPDDSAAIRQGDIFASLPQVHFTLSELFTVGEEPGSTYARKWEEVLNSELVRLIVTARPVTAIVITQDCDTIRADQITLCVIQPIKDVLGQDAPKEPKKFISVLMEQSKKNQKWFYLPPDTRIGFTDRMAVDFQVTLTVPRYDLERLRRLRLGRLNVEADEHFRERLSEFFRRYPVDEWYPLTPAEFDIYRLKATDATPRPWQAVQSNPETEPPAATGGYEQPGT